MWGRADAAPPDPGGGGNGRLAVPDPALLAAAGRYTPSETALSVPCTRTFRPAGFG